MPIRRDSIAQHVKTLVYNRPCIIEALRTGIVNYSALAALLQRELEKYGVSASISAIKVALVRLSKNLRETPARRDFDALKVLARSTLSLIDDVEVVTLEARRGRSLLPKLLTHARAARFFQLAQSTDTVTLMVDRETAEELRDLLSGGVLNYMRHQAAVIIKSPPEIVTTPGVVSYLTFLLSSRGINVTQIISCYRDTILVVESRDALQVYSILKEVMDAYRSEGASTNEDIAS